MSQGDGIETLRLRLRCFTDDDAGFVLELAAAPAFRDQLGDKGLRHRDDALAYIRGELSWGDAAGFGNYCVARREDGSPLGLCGLVPAREGSHANLRLALLEPYRHNGYGLEAARALLAHVGARRQVEFSTAVVSLGNVAARDLLTRLGFRLQRELSLGGGEEPVQVFAPDPGLIHYDGR